MKTFTLSVPQRITCFQVLNKYNGSRGHMVNAELWEIRSIMDAISRGAVMIESEGKININFTSCDEAEVIKLRPGQVNKIITALKNFPWDDVLAGVKADGIIKHLEDAPDEREEGKTDGAR